MKIGIKIKREIPSVYRLLLFFVIIFLLDYQLFYLFRFPSWMKILKDNQLNFMVGIWGAILTIWYYGKFKGQGGRLYTGILKYAVLCMFIWAAIVIYSILIYNKQPLRLALGFHATFLYYFLSVPAIVIFYNSRNKMKLFDIMNVVAIIWYLVIIYQHIEYAASGRFVFNMQELLTSSTREITRSHGIRISLKSLGNIMILYNFDAIFNRKKSRFGRNISFMALALGAFCMVFIQQTRAMTFVVLCSIAAIMVFGTKKVGKKLLMFAIGIIAFGVLIYTGTIASFFESFSTRVSNVNHYGTTIRLEAVAYYLECLLKNPLLGNGFTSSMYYPQVQHGSSMKYFYFDVGVIGLLGEVGLMAIPLYIYPLYRIIRNTYRLFRGKQISEYGFLAGITVYLLLSSITLLITSTNLMIAFPVIYAYSEYVNAVSYSERKKAKTYDSKENVTS